MGLANGVDSEGREREERVVYRVRLGQMGERWSHSSWGKHRKGWGGLEDPLPFGTCQVAMTVKHLSGGIQYSVGYGI